MHAGAGGLYRHTSWHSACTPNGGGPCAGSTMTPRLKRNAATAKAWVDCQRPAHFLHGGEPQPHACLLFAIAVRLRPGRVLRFFPKQRVQAAKPPCERERAGGREDRPPPLPLPLRASAVGCSARDTASPRPGLSQRLTSSVPEMTTTRQPGLTARLCRAIVFMTDVAARIPSARAEPPWCAAPLPSLLFCPS